MSGTISMRFSSPTVDKLEIDAAVIMCDPHLEKTFGQFSESLRLYGGKCMFEDVRKQFVDGGSLYGSCFKASSKSLKENGVGTAIFCAIPQFDVQSMKEENYLRLAVLNALARATEEKCRSIAIPLATNMSRKQEKGYVVASIVLLQSICLFFTEYPRSDIETIEIVTTDTLAIAYLRSFGNIFDVPIKKKYLHSLLSHIQRRPERRRLKLKIFQRDVRFFTDVSYYKADIFKIKLLKEELKLEAHVKLTLQPPSDYEPEELSSRAELISRLREIITSLKDARMKKIVKWKAPNSTIFSVNDSNIFGKIRKLKGGRGKKRSSGGNTSANLSAKRNQTDDNRDDGVEAISTDEGNAAPIAVVDENSASPVTPHDETGAVSIASTPSSRFSNLNKSLASKRTKLRAAKEKRANEARSARSSQQRVDETEQNGIIENSSSRSSASERNHEISQDSHVELTTPSRSLSTPQTPRTPHLDAQTGCHKRTAFFGRIGSQRLKMKRLRNYRTSCTKSTFEFDERRMENRNYRLEAMNELRKFISDKIATVRYHIRNQLQFDIAGPKNMSSMERKKRQLLRINIHIYTRECRDDGYDYKAMSEVFDEVWYQFMGFFNHSACQHAKNSRNVVNVDKPQLVANGSAPNNMEMEQEPEAEMEQGDVGEQTEDERIELSEEEDEIAMDCTQKSASGEEVNRVASALREELNLTQSEEFDSVFNLPPTDDEDNNSDGDSVARRARAAARRSPPPPSPVRLPDVGIIADIVEEQFGEQILEEIQQDDGYILNMIGQYTRARRCDDQCPRVDIKEAAAIHDALISNLRLMNGTAEEFRFKNLSYVWDGQVQSVLQWITEREQCSQGLRSIKKRYAELDNLITFLATCDSLIALEDYDGMKEFLSLDTLTASLRSEFREKFQSRKNEDHHKQQYVQQRFKKQLESFAQAQRDQETNLCDVCGKYTIPKYITSKPKSRYTDWLTDEVKERDTDVISICEICRKSKSLPGGALINNFMPMPVPEVLKCLNVLEQKLIERTRSNMKIFHLRSVNNKRTEMKGTRGVLVVIPTEIEATCEHVLNTLPSDSNLHIQVRTLWEKTYIVSMPKVLAALNWLKKNNPHYADVNIDPNFRFNLGENLVFERSDANEADAERMINRGSVETEDDGHLLTQDVIEEQTMQRVHEKRDTDEPLQKYLYRRNRYAPEKVGTPHLDVRSFPNLHPYGTDGLNAERTTPVLMAKYFRNRVLCGEIRWATNANWMTFMYGLKQQLNLTSVQGIHSRVFPADTTGKDFDLSDEHVRGCLSASYCKSRGYPQYWNSVKFCLRSHVAVFGPPTWFITLNPNVKDWNDLHAEYARKLNCEVNEHNIDRIIAYYPVVFSRYWKKRVAEFRNNVLLDKSGPLGEVTHFFHRTEYQHRGTQHVHCVLWTRDRPNPTASSDSVQDFIDAHATARLPDEKEEAELHRLVNNPQKHFDRHTRTCKRKVRMGRRVLTTRCRFGFPRPHLRRTVVWNTENKHRIPGVANRPYSLARRETEQMVNDYNAAVLLGWGGNIDLQYIPSNVKDVVNYITAYTTKGEKAKRTASDRLKQYSLEGMTKSKLIFKLGLDILEQREVGMLEITDDALGHKNFEFDTAHVFIPVDSKKKRQRILKPKNSLKDDEVIFETNWLDTYYPNRHKDFANFSLYNMMTNFEIVTSSNDSKTRRNKGITDADLKKQEARRKNAKKQKKSKDADWSDDERSDDDDDAEEDEEDDVDNAGIHRRRHIGDDRFNIEERRSPFYYHPDIENGEKFSIPSVKRKLIRKIKQRIGRFYLPRLVWDELDSVEDYYRRIVLLFVPWRDEEGILEDHDVSTFAEVWKKFMDKLKVKSKGAWEDITMVLQGYTDLLNEEKELDDRMEEIRRMKDALQVDEEVEEQIEIQSRIVDADKHKENEDRLNCGQREIYEATLKRIAEQHAVDEENKKIAEDNADLVRNGGARNPLKRRPEPIQMFISGTAGTGKSFLINSLADALTLLYVPPDASGLRPACILAGPTGIAALNIRGNTLHALLGIEVVQVDHRGEEEFQQLAPEKFDQLKILFSNVRLIIIDEVSMVSNIMLMKVHKRLRELSGRCEAFGGYNILMLGDLLQLPPVKAPDVFKKLNPRIAFSIFHAAYSSNVDLWAQLEYRELTENMRQGEDAQLAEMFYRIRTGRQTQEDIKTLKDRCIPAVNRNEPTMDEIAAFFVNDLLTKDDRAMALFGTNAEVNLMNATVLKTTEQATVTIDAIDSVDEQATSAIKRHLENKRKRPWQQRSLANRRNDDNSMRHLDRLYRQEEPVGKASDNSMHGGLPPQLTVSIGSRVMIRRNINIQASLVNGSTGVVTQIRRSSRSDDVEWIDVKLDLDGKVWPIQKMRALFKKKDEIMTRTQFPLIVAYGATIHKSQGLTLKNVLIRPKEIHADSAFFVAISRITTLDGLWFAGFDEEKIFFSRDAFQECNRLRLTIGMEPLLQGTCPIRSTKKIPPRHPPIEEQQQRQESRRKLTAAKRKQRIMFDSRHTPADVVRAMPPIGYDKELEKYGCCESVVHAVIHLVSMMEEVIAETRWYSCDDIESLEQAVLFQGLQGCLDGKHRSVEVVLNQWIKDSHDNNIEVVVDYMMQQVLPEEMVHMFSREYQDDTSCDRCKQKLRTLVRLPVLWIENGGKGSRLFDHISAQLDQSVTLSGQCVSKLPNGEICGGNLTRRRQMGSKSRFLVVGQRNGADSSYKPLPLDPFPIKDARFLLIGAISLGNQNPIRAWYKLPDTGALLFDADGRHANCNNIEMKGINFFVFVEKPKERLTDKERRRQEREEEVCDEFEDVRSRSSSSSSEEEELDEMAESWEIELHRQRREERRQRKKASRTSAAAMPSLSAAVVRTSETPRCEVQQRPTTDDQIFDDMLDESAEIAALNRWKDTREPRNDAASTSKTAMPSAAVIRSADVSDLTIPSSAQPKKCKGVQDDGNRRKKTADVAQPRRSAATARTNSDVTSVLLLRNSGTDCFLNTAVNMLYRAEPLREAILANASRGPFVNHLKAIFGPTADRSSIAFRRQMPDPFSDTTQQLDSVEVLNLILSRLTNQYAYHANNPAPEETVDLSAMMIPRQLYCSNPLCNNTIQDEHLGDGISTTVLAATQRDSLQRLLGEQQQRRQRGCDVCGNGEMRRREEDWENAGQFHLVTATRDDTQRFAEFPNTVEMFGVQWRLVAFGEHLTATGGSDGHYVTWTKEGELWYKVSDNHVSEVRAESQIQPRNMRMVQFVYERIGRRVNPVVLPPAVAPTRSSVSKNQEKVGRRVARPRHSPSPARTIKTRSSIPHASAVKLSDADRKEVLLLGNDSTNCFVNAAVNLLFTMRSFRDALIKRKRTGAVHRLLGNVFDRTVEDTVALREKLPGLREKENVDEVENEYDVNDALNVIVPELLEESDAQHTDFTFDVRITSICLLDRRECQDSVETEVAWQTWGLLEDNTSFATFMDSNFSTLRDCDDCKGKNARSILRVVDNTHRYHIVTIGRANTSARFASFPATEAVNMHGSRWIARSFAEYIPGHYRTWIRRSGYWLCISDQAVVSRIGEESMDLKNYLISAMVFEKVV